MTLFFHVLKIYQIYVPLAMLYNKCFSKCYFLDSLKIAKVITIYKKGIKY